MSSSRTLQDAAGIARSLDGLAAGLRQALGEANDVALVGVRRGGLALSRRLAERLRGLGMKVDLGTADISLYRDDAHLSWPRASIGPTEIPFAIDGRHVVVVDDVFWTGRTARAAMDAVLDFGRPRRLWFVTFAVRPGRELPIVPDLSAIEVNVPADEKVKLHLVEDGHPADGLVVEPRRMS